MAQQRSWNLYDDWKEVAHRKSSYRNQRKSNNKSCYGWKWKSWTACQFEGCQRWVYDNQRRSFCPQCIRPFPKPAPAKSPSAEPMCSPCGENFGINVPEGDPLAVLLAAADKIGWLGRVSLAAFLQSAQGKSKAKAPTPEHKLAQKESEYNKASANERLLEKMLQKSTEAVEKLRKQLQAEQGILGRLVPALSQAKETTKQSLDGSRAMRVAVHGAGADGDKNAPRPAPIEQDTDMFKQKIRLLNESAKRARTESNTDHSAILECVDGLLGEANRSIPQEHKRVGYHQYRPVSLTTSRIRKVSQIR